MNMLPDDEDKVLIDFDKMFDVITDAGALIGAAILLLYIFSH